ncbi:hypothetical protein [Streptacidiphilus anmyonensis]|uniref:hypothetical protein n=1 Tax=Streptacidiphilus anmyonensis TaxID=405782 RepID=UPI00128AFC45|nr:hypothetical protein [Streptacidiphilus anmyonensis]
MNELQETCAECARLDEQERAAYLSGDGSRQSDVRVLRTRHRRDAHGVPLPDFASSLLAGPFT